MRKVMRIHTFAKQNKVPSKYVLRVLNVIGNSMNSASSAIFIDETNTLYWDSVAFQAKREFELDRLTR